MNTFYLKIQLQVHERFFRAMRVEVGHLRQRRGTNLDMLRMQDLCGDIEGSLRNAIYDLNAIERRCK